MSGLKLGDFILDPRGLLYIPALKTVVCSGLKQAMAHSNRHYKTEITNKIQTSLKRHNPETILILGPVEDETGLSSIARRWGDKHTIKFVVAQPAKDAVPVAEALGFEIHQELIWDRFRFLEVFDAPPFIDQKDMQALDFQFMTIAGGADYFVRIGQAPFDPLRLFTGEKLRVFLRGLGRFKLPSLDPKKTLTSVFSATEDPFFPRYDVFALGHARILPLGKVSDLKQFVSLDALPVNRKALAKKPAPKTAPTSILPN